MAKLSNKQKHQQSRSEGEEVVLANNGGHSGEIEAALIGKRKRGLSEFVGF